MAKRDDKRWETMFNLYKEYLFEECRFPSSTCVYKDERLGEWFHNQYFAYHNGFISPERAKMLNAINPVWHCSGEERRTESKNLLLASHRRIKLKPGSIPIDKVFSDEPLLCCLSLRIHSCEDYLKAFDSRFFKSNSTYFWKSKRYSIGKEALFSMDNFQKVFDVQFKNLDFNSIIIHWAVFDGSNIAELLYSKNPSDYGKESTLYDELAFMNECNAFSSREKMHDIYFNLVEMLSPREKTAVYSRCVDGLSYLKLSKKFNVTEERARQIFERSLQKLYGPLFFTYMHSDFIKVSEKNNRLVDLVFKKLDIAELNLPFGICNCLYRRGIHTISQLSEADAAELLSIRGFSKEDLEEIRCKLSVLGISHRFENAKEDIAEHRAGKPALESMIASASTRAPDELNGSGSNIKGMDVR